MPPWRRTKYKPYQRDDGVWVKKCSKCHLAKRLIDFHVRNMPRDSLAVVSACKECLKERKPRPPEFKIYQAQHHLKTKYNLSIPEFEKLKQLQKNECAICARILTKPHVDHCSKTKKIRGLLCGSCNRGIGLLQHNPQVLFKAIQYLIKAANVSK